MKRKSWKVLHKHLTLTDKEHPDHCTYCASKLGEEHEEECPHREKTVVVSVEIELVVKVPEFWEDENIVFHRNESSWCQNNGLDEIKEALKRTDTCLCDRGRWFYEREATIDDERKDKLFIEDV